MAVNNRNVLAGRPDQAVTGGYPVHYYSGDYSAY